MTRKTFLYLILFTLSCNSDPKENRELANAKWYFYAYANELAAYDRKGNLISPLEVDLCSDL